MDYEKKYKELVDAVKVLRDNNPSDECIQNWVKDNVPELQEDEDELAWLKRYVEEEAYYLSMDIRGNEDRIKLKNLQRSLAWLEKQGEQKPQGKTELEPMFKVGDFIKHNKANIIYKVIAVNSNDNSYCVENIGTGGKIELSNAEQNYHLWTIKDANDGDIVVDKSDGAIGIFQSIGHHPDGGSCNDPSYCFLHCRYDDGFFYADFENGNTIGSDDLIPASKKQHDLLFQKMKEAGYEFDTEKNELIKIKQKPVDKVEPMFKVGDWIIYTINNNVEQILKLSSSEYICSGHLIVSFDNQHLLRKWCIQDAKPGDILASKDKTDILIFKNLDTNKSFSSYYDIKGIGELGWSSECFIPATKEQRKQLEKSMVNVGYKWNQENLKLEKL